MSEQIFKIAALSITITFYFIYLRKMAVQKKKGIVTNQIAKGRKPKKVIVIESVMKAATYLVVAAEVISIFFGWNYMPCYIRVAGIIFGIIGDIIFAVSVFTMKDNWRAGIPKDDKTSMVTDEIYRFSRNPAFVGFDFVYIGIVLMYFNIFLLIFSVWAAVMLHLQILQEEKYLLEEFGQEYIDYKNKVMRYIGRK